VLADLQRYVPQQDPRQTLLGDPTWILRLERRALGMHGAWAHGTSLPKFGGWRPANEIHAIAGLLQCLRLIFTCLKHFGSALGLALCTHASVTRRQSLFTNSEGCKLRQILTQLQGIRC
jgi:hypothetical protein